MYYIYVLYDIKRNKFYIGYTTDLKRRIREHKEGKCYTTVRFQNVKLIFYEVFLSKEDARRREKYFKTAKGKKVLRLMLKDTLKRICPVV